MPLLSRDLAVDADMTDLFLRQKILDTVHDRLVVGEDEKLGPVLVKCLDEVAASLDFRLTREPVGRHERAHFILITLHLITQLTKVIVKVAAGSLVDRHHILERIQRTFVVHKVLSLPMHISKSLMNLV